MQEMEGSWGRAAPGLGHAPACCTHTVCPSFPAQGFGFFNSFTEFMSKSWGSVRHRSDAVTPTTGSEKRVTGGWRLSV